MSSADPGLGGRGHSALRIDLALDTCVHPPAYSSPRLASAGATSNSLPRRRNRHARSDDIEVHDDFFERLPDDHAALLGAQVTGQVVTRRATWHARPGAARAGDGSGGRRPFAGTAHRVVSLVILACAHGSASISACGALVCVCVICVLASCGGSAREGILRWIRSRNCLLTHASTTYSGGLLVLCGWLASRSCGCPARSSEPGWLAFTSPPRPGGHRPDARVWARRLVW